MSADLDLCEAIRANSWFYLAVSLPIADIPCPQCQVEVISGDSGYIVSTITNHPVATTSIRQKAERS